MVFKICPRCGHVFACEEGNVLKCHCSKVSLTSEQRKRMAAEYNTCLCHECLVAYSRD